MLWLCISVIDKISLNIYNFHRLVDWYEYKISGAEAVADVTEDQFLADEQQASTVLVTTFDEVDVNDEENELYRVKRDASEQTTLPPDNFSEFRRPTTPDPDVLVEETEYSANALEEIRDILMREEGVNATGEYVRGRSSCSKLYLKIIFAIALLRT